MADNALLQVISSIKRMGQESGVFRKTAADQNRTISQIVKDISSVFQNQQNSSEKIINTIQSQGVGITENAQRINNTNSLLRQSIDIQERMLTQLNYISKAINNLTDVTANKDSGGLGSIISNIFGGTNLGKLAAGLVKNPYVAGTAGLGGLALGGKDVYDVLYGGPKNPNLLSGGGAGAGAGASGAGGSGGGNAPVNTNFTGQELDAKKSAEKYLGRTIEPKEWSELIRATSAEAGLKNQTEVAMVMATILNRARSNYGRYGKSISDQLYAKKQFQAVTGTDFNKGPSPNFINQPNQNRLDQIYGAATNILEKVDKKQTNFTAASRSAYGLGTNPNYRNELLNQGGARVGGSIFNTPPPNLENAPQQNNAPNTNSGARVSNESAPAMLPTSPGGTMNRQGVEFSIGALHPEFRSKLNDAINEARQQGLNVSIHSAYRTPSLGVGAFGDKMKSLHSYGLATDVSGIGVAGSEEAKKWYEIATKHGLFNPYGPSHEKEWNHYQMIPDKSIGPDHPLRKTITPNGPINLQSMWDAAKSSGNQQNRGISGQQGGEDNTRRNTQQLLNMPAMGGPAGLGNISSNMGMGGLLPMGLGMNMEGMSGIIRTVGNLFSNISTPQNQPLPNIDQPSILDKNSAVINNNNVNAIKKAALNESAKVSKEDKREDNKREEKTSILDKPNSTNIMASGETNISASWGHELKKHHKHPHDTLYA